MTARKQSEGASAPSSIQPPESELAELLASALSTMGEVLSDRAVWEEESRRAAARLPWPIARPHDGYAQLGRLLVNFAVERALETMRNSDGITLHEDVNDPRFQLVLRVCKRAVDAADRKIVSDYGGASRIDGKRDFLNWVKSVLMEEAARSGLKGKAAAKAAGLSVASSYRAQHRKSKKPRR